MVAYLISIIPRDYHFLKIPKFKCATAAHCANQAKKRHRNQRGARRSRSIMQSLDDNFVWITQKEGNRNNNVIQKLTDKFVKAIHKEDMKNKYVIQLPTDKFIKTI